MVKRIQLYLLVLCILLTAGCSSNANSDRIATPPGHEEFVAVIGKNLSDAVGVLGVSESDLSDDTGLPGVYKTGKTVMFGGVEFHVCIGMFMSDTVEVVNNLYYLRNYKDDLSGFSTDVLNVAKELEQDFNRTFGFGGSDDVLTKNISPAELEEAFSRPEGHQIDDTFDITETAPENVQEHMEFMMNTDYWKEFCYFDENIPIPAGYMCQFTASCIPEYGNGAMFIAYFVQRRPGSYMTEITS